MNIVTASAFGRTRNGMKKTFNFSEIPHFFCAWIRLVLTNDSFNLKAFFFCRHRWGFLGFEWNFKFPLLGIWWKTRKTEANEIVEFTFHVQLFSFLFWFWFFEYISQMKTRIKQPTERKRKILLLPCTDPACLDRQRSPRFPFCLLSNFCFFSEISNSTDFDDVFCRRNVFHEYFYP